MLLRSRPAEVFSFHCTTLASQLHIPEYVRDQRESKKVRGIYVES
jgi:hypothetical protein